MAGAVAEPFYGGVSEKISGLCSKYLDSDLKSLMESFESRGQYKNLRTGQIQKMQDNSFKVIKRDSERCFVVPSYRKDIIGAIKEKFGDDARIIAPKDVKTLLKSIL
jgi:hypothetical protein